MPLLFFFFFPSLGFVAVTLTVFVRCRINHVLASESGADISQGGLKPRVLNSSSHWVVVYVRKKKKKIQAERCLKQRN